MENIIYLDNAASSPMRPEALEAMSAYARDHYANPSAIHALGQAARQKIEKARVQVAGLIGADASEIIFTSGATEANNLAIRGVIEPLLDGGKPVHAVTTALEHASVSKTFEALARRGLALTIVPPGPDGIVRAADVVDAVRPETALVSVIAVSNELGARQPIEEIGRALGSRFSARGGPALGGRGNDGPKPLFHTDAVQAVVSTDLTFASAQADLFTISAHKIGGPKGIGALAVRRGLKLVPILTGGGHENGLRSGTENGPGIAGFGAAATALLATRDSGIKLYENLRERLYTNLPNGMMPLLKAETPCAPHIFTIECAGKENDWVVLLLSRAGVMVSAGSACKSGSREASGVVKALGLNDDRARSIIRVSLGWDNDEKDVEVCITALSRLRNP